MNRSITLLLTMMAVAAGANAQVRFRSGIFLHHSTGGCIWEPNGSATSVPLQMHQYNVGHGYSGPDSVSLHEQWYPAVAGDNEWSTWHAIFETDLPDTISDLCPGNRIIMIKSCFPSSDLWGIGQPSDTAAPADKTICNYKWHWRHIVSAMNGHRDNFFAIWTNAPLEANSTDSSAARLSDIFCHWAKDTLAAGLDPVYGAFPPNVHVFDFFHLLANAQGFLPDAYRTGPGDSHPNAAATALVAPLLVAELFDAAIAYEPVYNGLAGGHHAGPAGPAMAARILDIRPNPCAAMAVIDYQLAAPGAARVRIYDVTGRLVGTLLDRQQPAGRHSVEWDGRDRSGKPAAAGVYVLRLQAGGEALTAKLMVVH